VFEVDLNFLLRVGIIKFVCPGCGKITTVGKELNGPAIIVHPGDLQVKKENESHKNQDGENL
jgi:hypothetical protein